MILFRLTPAVASLLVLVGAAGAAHAQGKLDARYTASLLGVPIGSGSWQIVVDNDRYAIGATGSTSGVLHLFAHGKGNVGVSGSVAGGRLVPASYSMNITDDDEVDRIDIIFAAGAVKRVIPTPKPSPNRVLLTEAHYRGVVDPLTGSLVRVAGTGDPVSAEACQGATAVFNGRIRFEVRREFKRLESVQAEGYQGPVVVCALYFTPIAGYNPARTSIKYLAQQKDMELWFAPIANTRVLAPFRFSVPTPFGLGVLQATHFVSAPARGGSTANAEAE